MGPESRLFYSLEDYKRITGYDWQPRVFPCDSEERPANHFDAKTKALVWDKTGGRCHYCGNALNPFSDFTIDHIIPVARDGSDELENLIPACRLCNCRKGVGNEPT